MSRRHHRGSSGLAPVAPQSPPGATPEEPRDLSDDEAPDSAPDLETGESHSVPPVHPLSVEHGSHVAPEGPPTSDEQPEPGASSPVTAPVAAEPMLAQPPQPELPALGVVLPATPASGKYRVVQRVVAKGINMIGRIQETWEPGQVGAFAADVVANAPHCFAPVE